MAVGLATMAAAFLLPLLTTSVAPPSALGTTLVVLVPLLLSAALLTLGSVIVFPFEMDTIVTLSGNRSVATHYGLYNTICGAGIAAGALGTGAVLDLSRGTQLSWLPWAALALTGAGSALAVWHLGSTGRLNPQTAVSV